MVQIEDSWKQVLASEFEKPYFAQIVQFLKAEKSAGKVIYPPGIQIFNAFDTTPFDAVKVVILGQDPYHGPGQAMGLSFSVPKTTKIPASLKNIYKEIYTDLTIPIANHGDLTSWAKQGVFLLNAMLTVEATLASSHKNIGWQLFTDSVIHHLSEKRSGLVFLLWGNFARAKKDLIDPKKHLILEAAHPSPLAGGAFFGCKHFSKANAYLKRHNQQEIDWSIS